MSQYDNQLVPQRLLRSRKRADAFQWIFYLLLWSFTLCLGLWLGFREGSVRTGLIISATVLVICLFYAVFCLSWHVKTLVKQDQSSSGVIRVKRLLDPLCRRANIKTPDIFIMKTDAANACAAGVLSGLRCVGVTQGALRLLDDRELGAVLAHEVTHLQRRDSLFDGWWIALSGVVIFLEAVSVGMGIAMLTGSSSRRREDDEDSSSAFGLILILGGIVFGIISVFIIQLVRHNIMRRREYRADEGAVLLTGSASPLIRALRKLEGTGPVLESQSALAMMFSVNPSPMSNWWDGLFATHPKTSKRIARLQALGRKLGETSL